VGLEEDGEGGWGGLGRGRLGETEKSIILCSDGIVVIW
jgi:hypothetical protein